MYPLCIKCRITEHNASRADQKTKKATPESMIRQKATLCVVFWCAKNFEGVASVDQSATIYMSIFRYNSFYTLCQVVLKFIFRNYYSANNMICAKCGICAK